MSASHPATMYTAIENKGASSESLGTWNSELLCSALPVDFTAMSPTTPTKSTPYDDCMPFFAEALASPVKYAFFQVLGFEFIRTIVPIDISLCVSGSWGSSACIGAWGGAVLAVLYIALFFSKQQPEEDTSATVQEISSSLFQSLGKEAVYSAFAAVIGSTIIGRDASKNLSYFVIAGLLGPIVASIFMFGGLGIAFGAAWSTSKLKDKLAGY